MAITLDPSEYIAALGDLTPLVNDSMGGMQGVDILNQFSRGGGGSYNIPNGGFARPVATTDPSYSSGYDYARSIAGGMPMSQVIAPGVSYSPEQPMGYTQEQLNLPKNVNIPPPPPPILPPTREPDDPSFFGTGIGGVTIPGGRRDKMPPLRNIFGDMPTTVPPVQAPLIQVPPQEFDIEQIRQDIADSGIDFTNLFGLPTYEAPDLSQFVTKEDLPTGREFSVDQLNLPDFSEFALREDLPVYQEPDLSQFVTKQDLPSLIPEAPTGRDFSIDQFDLPDFNQFALRKDLPVYKEPDLSDYAKITDLPTFNPQNYRDDFLSIAREGIEIPEYKAPDLSGYARIEDLPTVPTFDRQSLIEDIRSGIDIPKPPSIDRQSLIEDIRSGIELPTYQAPDLSGFMTQADINKAIAGIDMPSYQAPDISSFMTQEDINKAISGINMPTYEQPDLSAYDTRIAELEQSLAALQQPTGNRFSINQPQARGLF